MFMNKLVKHVQYGLLVIVFAADTRTRTVEE